MKQRLSKILAGAGVASRRASEELITSGRVTVNGAMILKPEEHFDPAVDKIVVDSKKIRLENKVYYMLHKPRGFLSSSKRLTPNQRLVIDLLPVKERIYTVGRLDKDSEGLILLTNDGNFSNQVIHPRSNVEKEYLVKTKEFITHEDLVQLSKGMFLDGKRVRPVSVKKIRKNTFTIVIKEGKKREVRFLAEKAGLNVVTLKRIRIGKLLLGSLKAGAFRQLSKRDKELIFE